MNMNKLLTTLALLCFSVGANAQLDENFKNFLKVTDPNELPYFKENQNVIKLTFETEI